jgi:hypothetical protein
MDPLLAAIEHTALGTWLRESPSVWALPAVLVLHTWGLAFLVGTSVAVDARLLGAARGATTASFRRFVPVMWIGFWANAISGVLLLIAYPTKALTNPVFYVKLFLIAVGVLLAHTINREIRATSPAAASPRVRRLAIVSIACWAGAIVAGRLLAYTYSRLLVDFVG